MVHHSVVRLAHRWVGLIFERGEVHVVFHQVLLCIKVGLNFHPEQIPLDNVLHVAIL
jgi:hypothetical protein